MAKKKAGPVRLRDQLRQRLLDLIISGRLAGGQKLNELELSRLLKASRTPLREALLHLEREGFVRSDLRRGFTVEPLSARDVREIYPMLAELECFAVRGSVGFLPLVLPEAGRINARFRRARTAQQAIELDAAWHDTLMSKSRNARVAAIVGNLRLEIARYERFYMADAALVAMSADQHDEILRLFRASDVERGLGSLRENYLFGMRALLQKMGEP
jgi:DNA-binding GntR family transcriptional regulator